MKTAKEKTLTGGCAGEENGWNTQLLYFTGSSLSRDDYNAYGHFTMDHDMNLVCDGYFKFPEDVKVVRENSTDNGPDPHKKDGEYISKVIPDWDRGVLTWIPFCKHSSDWLGQDAHRRVPARAIPWTA